MSEEYKQRTIEYFFEKYSIENPDLKAKILPQVTDIIYDYNMHIVKYEKETDEYKKNQIIEGIDEIEAKIKDIFDETAED